LSGRSRSSADILTSVPPIHPPAVAWGGLRSQTASTNVGSRGSIPCYADNRNPLCNSTHQQKAVFAGALPRNSADRTKAVMLHTGFSAQVMGEVVQDGLQADLNRIMPRSTACLEPAGRTPISRNGTKSCKEDLISS
jgi:hypothetical protein